MADNFKDDWQELPVEDSFEDDWEEIDSQEESKLKSPTEMASAALSTFKDTVWGDKKLMDIPETFSQNLENASYKEPIQEDNRPSGVESLVRGAAQGLTFDMADELSGAAEALHNVALGPDQLKDVIENYERYRDSSREQFKKAEQENPKLYATGDILGGILPATVTGGASALANIGKTGLKTAIKESAKAGAKAGALVGLGRTEDITDIPEAFEDVTKSAASTAVIGAGLPIAGKGVEAATDLASGIGKYVKKLPVIDDAIKAFELAKSGKSAIGEEVPKETLQNIRSSIEDLLIPALESKGKIASKKIGKTIDLASELGGAKNQNKILNQIENNLKEFQSKKVGVERSQDKIQDILDVIENYKTTNIIKGKSLPQPTTRPVTARELQDIKQDISQIQQQNYKPSGDVFYEKPIAQSAKDISEALKGQLQSVDPKLRQTYENANLEYSNIKSLLDDFKNLQDPSTQQLHSAVSKYSSLGGNTKSSDIAELTLDRLKQQIDPLIPKESEQFSKILQENAERYDIANKARQIGEFGGSIRSLGIRAGDFTGKTAANIESQIPEQISKPYGAIKKVLKSNNVIGSFGQKTGQNMVNFDTSDESLNRLRTQVPENLQGSVGLQLDKAMSASGAEREALLFGLKQQPAFRELLKRINNDM